ncbi:MAG: nucleotidyltransferase domain-containing protein [Deltaproteobacteria bacterium]|nr:nucleotidyltransferase domain-containing protein [Deltaproteobacteria bacterium]
MAKTAARRNPKVRRTLSLLRKATDRLVANGFRIRKAFLYGSFAKGRATKWSDIDVAFITPDYRPSDIKQWVRIAMICQEVDIRIEPVVYRPEDFPGKDPLAAEIHRSGIALD